MAVTSTTEVELKYAVPEGLDLPDLRHAAHVGGAAPQPVAHLEAVYLDTADRVLLAARIALRRRTGGHDAGWHVKLPASAGRVELQAPIDAAEPDRLPAGLERALRSRLRGAPLQPLARIATERRGTVVSGAPGTATEGGRVEVVDDRVRATDVAAGVQRGWREWEAEQLGGSPADAALLAAVDAVLRGAGASVSDSPAKLAQALGGATAEQPPRRPERTAGEVLSARLALLAEQLHRGVLTLAVQGDGDGAAVHGLRKVLRRMRSLLSLRPVAGPLGEDLRDRLGVLAAALGAARDPLIAAGLAEGLLAALPAGAPGLEAARSALVVSPRAAVPAATARAVEALLDDRASAAYALLDRLLAEGPDGPEAGARPRRLVALARKADRRARRRAAGRHLDLDGLHSARKAAKRSRMIAEELVDAGLLGPGSRLAASAERSVRVQEALGEHRDLALLLGSLPDAAVRITADGGNAYAAGLMSARAARRLHRLERTARRRMRTLRA